MSRRLAGSPVCHLAFEAEVAGARWLREHRLGEFARANVERARQTEVAATGWASQPAGQLESERAGGQNLNRVWAN